MPESTSRLSSDSTISAMDLFIVIPLMLAASDCIDAIDERTPASKLESLRSTLILVTKGLRSQRRKHYLAEALFQVIRGRMRPPEVALFRGIMNGRRETVHGAGCTKPLASERYQKEGRSGFSHFDKSPGKLCSLEHRRRPQKRDCEGEGL